MTHRWAIPFLIWAVTTLAAAPIPLALAAEPGAYNVVGVEDGDYDLTLLAVKRGQSFDLNDEKISFYMLGCDRLPGGTDQRWEFAPRSAENGAKLVFIAPEAGRKSGTYATADFYPHANAILRIKGADRIVYKKTEDWWRISIESGDEGAELVLESKKGSYNRSLRSVGDTDAPFQIDLHNYTLSREDAQFLRYHTFSPHSPFHKMQSDGQGDTLGEPIAQGTIAFTSSEIMLRTFETRLSAGSRKSSIEVDRRPSRAIIGSIIRFTGEADDGDNLATVTGIDANENKIFIKRYDSLNYNNHPAGTWLRCFSDGGNGQVYDNEYPKVSLEPTTWKIDIDDFVKLMNDYIVPADASGLLQEIRIQSLVPVNFGYGLKNVTLSSNKQGLNFTGGLIGEFDIGFTLNFFGWPVVVGPVHIDYASMANSIMDEILRINTYKREAFRFYLNPYFFESYCDWGGLTKSPSVFPLTFRMYFDKAFNPIGGNVKIKLPNKWGIPLPGGLVKITTIGGGYTIPSTFEVGAIFQDAGLDKFGVTFWNANVDAVLAFDQAYLSVDGRVWMWDQKVRVGQASATVAWSYKKGKRFKGFEFKGETGAGASHVNFIVDLYFKIKRYISRGRTKTYIGGGGTAKIEAFGATFGGRGIRATSRKFYAYINPPGPIGTKKITIYYNDILHPRISLTGDDSGLSTLNDSEFKPLKAAAPSRGVAAYVNAKGHTLLLMPEAVRISQNHPQHAYTHTRSAAFGTTLNLPEATPQAAITLNYQGSISDIAVSLPGGSTAPVVISDEDTVEEPGKLYAMDYAIDDTERQLYIEINTAEAGDYTLSCNADAVSDTAIYEIIQVPEIQSGQITATYAGGLVDLGWNLAEQIDGDVKYHLTLQSLVDGEVAAEYPLYENMVVDEDGDDEDDGEEVERYVDAAALTTIGTSVATRVKLPANLPSGTYAFVVEPVRDEADEDDLEGDAATSDTFTHLNTDYGAIVSPPTGVIVENTGNGVTQVRWDLDPTVYSWDIALNDTDGATVGTVSILREDLVLGRNLYIDPFSGQQYVYADIGVDSNTFATALIPEAAYDTDYDFTVTAVQRIPHAGGAYYNAVMGYIDMDNIEADLNEDYLIYKADAPGQAGLFVESQGISFYAEIYTEGKAEPVFTANLFEVGTGEIGYDYDMDADLELESLRQIDPGALSLRTNALDSLKLLPDGEIKKLGIVILTPTGEELLNIPTISLANLTLPENWTALAAELATSYPNLNLAALQQLQQIHAVGAVRLEEARDIRIDLAHLVDAGLIDALEPGRYTIAITAYNTNNDRTITDFEILVREIDPAPFFDKFTRLNGDRFQVSGVANGASAITLNGAQAEVIEGSFELTTTIDSGTMAYEIIDEFGTTYTGTITLSDYQEIQSGGSGGSGDPLSQSGCFISRCAPAD